MTELTAMGIASGIIVSVFLILSGYRLKDVIRLNASLEYQFFWGILLGVTLGGMLGSGLSTTMELLKENENTPVSFSVLPIFVSIVSDFTFFYLSSFTLTLDSILGKVEHPGDRFDVIKRYLAIGGVGIGGLLGKNSFFFGNGFVISLTLIIGVFLFVVLGYLSYYLKEIYGVDRKGK